MIMNIRDDCTDGGLGAGAGGRGNNEEGRQFSRQFKEAAHFFDALAVGDFGRDDLSAVDRRTAAERDHAVTIRTVIHRQAVFNVFEGWIRLHLVKNDRFNAVCFQGT